MKENERFLFFVRHGETDFNKQGICQGRLDISLNDYGRQQSKCLGAILKNIIIQNKLDIRRIHASPQLRARETAEIIGREIGIYEIIAEPLLEEINHGEWEGLKDTKIENLYPELWRQFNKGDRAGFEFPEGESMAQASCRAKKGIIKITANDEKDILIVGHGGSGILAIIGLLGLPRKTLNSVSYLKNTEIVALKERNGRWKILLGEWSPHLIILEGFNIRKRL